MKLREAWDRYYWLVALIALEAVLLLAVFGAPEFCVAGEPCGRQILITFTGPLSGLIAAISVFYLARQVSEARRQNDISISLQNRRVASIAKRAGMAAAALRVTFSTFEEFARARPSQVTDLATCVFRAKSALEAICSRFEERALDEFEELHANGIALLSVRRTTNEGLGALRVVYEAASQGNPAAERAYADFLIKFDRRPFLLFLDGVITGADEILQSIEPAASD